MNEFEGYVSQLTQGNYTPSFWGILCIDINYKFLLKCLNKNSKILEIGPGNGFFIDWLIMNDLTNITFVDLDNNNVEYLNNKYKDYPSIKGFYQDGIKFLESNNEKYDLIISRQVLEHLNTQDIIKYFNYSSNNLKANGILVTETINAQNIYYGNFCRYDDSTHKNSFTEKSIIQYGGSSFYYEFYDFNNLNIYQALLGYLHNNKILKYNQLINKKLKIKNNKDEPDKSKIAKIKNTLLRGYKFFKLSYYQYRSKKVSKKYLSNFTSDSANCFSYFIIAVMKKI